MKTLHMIFLMMVLAGMSDAQISPADAQAIRELEARAISAEKTVAIQEGQIAELKASRSEWKNLFDKERDRADKQQEAIILYEKRITNFTDQHNADKARIDTLERDKRSLKSQRNLALLANGLSFGAGYFIGQQKTSAPTIINNTPSAFNATIRF